MRGVKPAKRRRRRRQQYQNISFQFLSATGDLHAYSTPSKEHFVGPTLVNKNHSQQEDDSHDDVGEHQ
jgi:hypothetical protein